MITAANSVPSPPSSPENEVVKRQSPDVPDSINLAKSTITLPVASLKPNTITQTESSIIIKPLVTATIVSNQGLSAKDFQSCKNLLAALQKHTAASPFLKPVDPIATNAPDYFTIVKHPMDLSTVEKKLNSGLYNSVQAFGADIDLMFSNCFRYNPEESHPIHEAGKKLKVAYNNLLTSHFPTMIDAAVSIPTTIYHPAVNTNVYQPPNSIAHYQSPQHPIPSHPQTANRKTLANSITANRSRRKSVIKRQWELEPGSGIGGRKSVDHGNSVESIHRRQSSSTSLGSTADGVVPNEANAAASLTPSLLPPFKKPRKRAASSEADGPAKRRGRKGKKSTKAVVPTPDTNDPSVQIQMLTQQVALMSAMLQQATAAAQQSSTDDEEDDDDDDSSEATSETGGMDGPALQQQYVAAYASAFAQSVIDVSASNPADVESSPTDSQPASPSRASSVEPKYTTRSATRALNPDAELPSKSRRLSDPPAPTIRNRRAKSYKKSPRRKSMGPSPTNPLSGLQRGTKKALIINGQIVDSNYLANLAERIAQLPETGQIKIAEFVKTSKSGWTTDLDGELEIDFDLLEDHVLARIDDYCRHHLHNISGIDASDDVVVDAITPTPTPSPPSPYTYGDVMLPIMDFGLNPMPAIGGMTGAAIDDDLGDLGDLGDDLQSGDIIP